MADTTEGGGRARQRRRTRAAIVAAAADLLREGNGSPGVAEIAEAADVSRRTVYQYFPTVDQLLLDATLGLLTQSDVDAAIDAVDPQGADAAQRVDAMIAALQDRAAATLPLGRSLIRLTVEATEPTGEAANDSPSPKRGYRRIGWIERALEPLRHELSPQHFERLVSALAMVVGWEALIVLHDLRGLDDAGQLAVTTWAARALIEAARAERGTES